MTEIFRDNYCVGKVTGSGDAVVQSGSGSLVVGRVAEDGTVFDRNGVPVGGVSTGGIVTDSGGETVGEVDVPGNVYRQRTRCGMVRGTHKQAGGAALLLLISEPQPPPTKWRKPSAKPITLAIPGDVVGAGDDEPDVRTPYHPHPSPSTHARSIL